MNPLNQDFYRLFSIYIESEELPEDFDPSECSIEDAEEFGELICKSVDLINLLTEIVCRLNNEMLTDHNWFLVFKNDELIIF